MGIREWVVSLHDFGDELVVNDEAVHYDYCEDDLDHIESPIGQL